MFSFERGRPIAVVRSQKKGIQIMGITDEDPYEYQGNEGFIEYEVMKGEKIVPLPNFQERFIEYIAGPTGSGKSTMAAELAEEFYYEFQNDDIPIYIFSRTNPDDDPAWDNIEAIGIELNERLIENPIDITKQGFKDGCLMIFDDINTVHDEAIKYELNKLVMDAMEVGRKLNCNMIITNHLVIPNEKKLARTILNELTMLTVFPKSGSAQQIRYCLKTYFGLSNNQINDILALRSRWVRISKNYPMYVLHEHGAYIL